MVFDNQVKAAFIISVIFHSFVIFSWPAISKLLPKRPVENFEITYYRAKDYKSVSQKSQPALQKQQAPRGGQASPRRQEPVKTIRQNKDQQLVAVKKKIEQAKIENKQQLQPKKVEPAPVVKENVVIPPLPAGVEKIPGYLDYVQSVREKIRKTANAKFSNQGLEGDVMLYFILLNDGALSAVKIVEERSAQDGRLKEAGRLAIQSAAPFGAFPQDLEYKQLSFSVVISFE